MDEELARLQVLLMEQQSAMETLNEQVLSQERRFIALERKLALLEQRLEMILELGRSGSASPPADEKPPHY